MLDILAPKTDGASYAPPGIAKPTVTAMSGDRRTKPGASQAQAQAIAQASQQLAGTARRQAGRQQTGPCQAGATQSRTQPAEPAKQQPQPAPPVQTAVTPARAAIPVADARRTRDGAIITFKGAGPLPAAVFVRGLTAWVVLENAPAFDSGNLKPALGDFAAGIEAASANGLGILRITLKAPAEIAARSRARPAGGDRAQCRARAHHHQLRPQPERSAPRLAFHPAARRRPCLQDRWILRAAIF